MPCAYQFTICSPCGSSFDNKITETTPLHIMPFCTTSRFYIITLELWQTAFLNAPLAISLLSPPSYLRKYTSWLFAGIALLCNSSTPRKSTPLKSGDGPTRTIAFDDRPSNIHFVAAGARKCERDDSTITTAAGLPKSRHNVLQARKGCV